MNLDTSNNQQHYYYPPYSPYQYQYQFPRVGRASSVPYLDGRSMSIPPNNQPTPLTPIDLHYGYSMLPSNLMASPYINQQAFPMPPPHHPYGPDFVPAPQVPRSPYLTSNKNDYRFSNPWGQLNVSRTIILKNLNNDLTLNQLLDHIDFGPIEYIKMFSKSASKNFKDIDNFKVCHISFINSEVSINFQLKYNSPEELNKLKTNLKSEHLRINLNDNRSNMGNMNASNKDFIKLKTLNYILDFKATRAVKFHIRLNDSSVDNAVSSMKSFLNKFGEYEDFQAKVEESKKEITFIVHFTSIDSAIKSYEFHLKKVQIDKQKVLDNVDIDQSKLISVNFTKDRCDLTQMNRNGSLNSQLPKQSPDNLENNLASRKHKTEKSNDENDANASDLNPELILESNESLRNNLLSQKSHVLSKSSNDTEIENETNINVNENTDNTNNDTFEDFDNYSAISSNRLNLSNPALHTSNAEMPYFPLQQPVSSYQYNPDPYNIGNRTIYLGNLHPNTTVEEIANNVRAGGLVESIKFYPDKRNCFITFIDPNIALKFFLNHQVLHQLIIHGYDINVGWAKSHSGPLNREVALAVTAGASRNVYIGIKMVRDQPSQSEKPTLPNEIELRKDFEKFGELEQINFFHNKDCGFLNFCNIIDAIRLVEMFEFKNSKKVSSVAGDSGELFLKYKDFKISFAKDRCGNPPKFSFKKNFGKSRQKVYFDNHIKNKLNNNTEEKDDDSEDPITDEAAMIFGIIKNDTLNDKQEQGDSKTQDSKESDQNKQESESPEVEADSTPNNSNIAIGENRFEEDEDEDDDDDISIIIGSDDTSSTTANNSNNNNRGEKKKFHSNSVNDSDPLIPFKGNRNNSSFSLNSNHNKSYPKSPYGNHSLPHTPKQFHPSYYQRSNSNHGFYPIQPMPPFSTPQQVPPSMSPQPLSVYPDNPVRNGSFSGSQVMAQYLAKSQSDHLFYQPNVVYNSEDSYNWATKSSKP